MWVIYFAEVTGNLSAILATIGVGSALLGAIFFSVGTLVTDDKDDVLLFGKRALKAGLIALAAYSVVPSQKTVYMMLGVSVAGDIAKSDTAQKVYKLIDGYLDDELKKLAK